MITAKEFKGLIATLGLDLDNEGATRLFNEIDVDGSEVIDLDEFMAWYLKRCLLLSPEGGSVDSSGSYYFVAE